MYATIDGRVTGIPEGARPAAAGDLTTFRYIDDADVPDFTRHLARKITDRAAKELGLDRVGLRWFRYLNSYRQPDGDGWFERSLYYRRDGRVFKAHVNGVTPGSDFGARANEAGEIICGASRRGEPAIGILAGIEGQLLACAIGHEARHVWQFVHGRWRDAEAMESDADEWGGRFALRQEPYIARLTRRAA